MSCRRRPPSFPPIPQFPFVPPFVLTIYPRYLFLLFYISFSVFFLLSFFLSYLLAFLLSFFLSFFLIFLLSCISLPSFLLTYLIARPFFPFSSLLLFLLPCLIFLSFLLLSYPLVSVGFLPSYFPSYFSFNLLLIFLPSYLLTFPLPSCIILLIQDNTLACDDMDSRLAEYSFTVWHHKRIGLNYVQPKLVPAVTEVIISHLLLAPLFLFYSRN